VKFPSLVFEIWCSQGFRWTHSLTFGQSGTRTRDLWIATRLPWL